MLDFDGFHAGVSWTLLTQTSEFVTRLSPERPEAKTTRRLSTRLETCSILWEAIIPLIGGSSASLEAL